MKLRVAPEAGSTRGVVQILSTGIEQRLETFETKTVTVVDERDAHFPLEHASQAAEAQSEISRDLPAGEVRLFRQAPDRLDDHRIGRRNQLPDGTSQRAPTEIQYRGDERAEKRRAAGGRCRTS